jgi:hypothetical protein
MKPHEVVEPLIQEAREQKPAKIPTKTKQQAYTPRPGGHTADHGWSAQLSFRQP